MFIYSHANESLSQSECAYYVNHFINVYVYVLLLQGKAAQITYWLVGSDRKRTNLRSPKPMTTPQLSGRKGRRQLIRQASKKFNSNTRNDTRSHGELNGDIANISSESEYKLHNIPNDLNKGTYVANNGTVNNNLPQINA